MNLTKFEKNCIEEILRIEAPDYLDHLDFIEVISRDMTGVGFFIRFRYVENQLVIKLEKKTLGKTLYADIDGLKWGAGFVLYIDAGKITCLEGVSHGSESWPEIIDKYSLKSEYAD